MANKECGDFGCFGIFVNEKTMYQAMNWWVEALRSTGIPITIDNAILLFMKKNSITEEQLDVKNAKEHYNRFRLKLIERIKQNG